MNELIINVKPVTMTLILISFSVFLLGIIFPKITYVFSNIFILNAFVHSNWTHLLVNMGFLFFLGNAFEIHSNSYLTLFLFFISVILGNLFFLIAFPTYNAVGISAFIYGLIGALMIRDPKLKILMPIGLISIPAPVIIAGPVLAFIEFIFSFTISDGIAHIAHLGGFLGGIIVGVWKNEQT